MDYKNSSPAKLGVTQTKAIYERNPIQNRTRIPDATDQKLGHYTNNCGHHFHNESKCLFR